MHCPSASLHRAPLGLGVALAALVAFASGRANALGEETRVEIVGVQVGDETTAESRPTARRRMAWEVRQRTSIETRLEPRRMRLDDPALFHQPLLYWAGDSGYDELSEAEIIGLRRFVEFGGMLLIDNAGGAGAGGRSFDTAIRRTLRRAFPRRPLSPLPADHTVFRSFYLLSRPEGRVRGEDHLHSVDVDGRAAVVYSRHDLGGAWARDNLGTWQHAVTPGGERQRENAIRLGVNLVMYALCLDYKDDQVHAPYIMRRRGGSP